MQPLLKPDQSPARQKESKTHITKLDELILYEHKYCRLLGYTNVKKPELINVQNSVDFSKAKRLGGFVLLYE